MAKDFNSSSLTDGIKKAIITICQDRITKSILNDELQYITDAVDISINQKTDIGYFTGNNILPTALNNTVLNESDAVLEQENQGIDEFSFLKVPLLYKLHRSWVGYIKAASFPIDGDQVKIDRDNDQTFNDLNIKDFLKINNEEWEQILKVENEKFGYNQKYAANIAEVCAYGITGAIHFYNDIEHFIDIKAPGVRNIGVWPLTDRWQEATLLIKYDMPYYQFKNRFDFDEYAREVIRPADGSFSSMSRDVRYSARNGNKFNRTDDIPADHVRLYDFYFPSLYITDPETNEEFYLEKASLTIAINPKIKTPDNIDSNITTNQFILKINQDVDIKEFGLTIGRFGSTLPGQLYHRGPLIPFLSDQLQLNQMKSGISRIAAFMSDPPISAIPNGADYEQTPPDKFEAGAIYNGWDVKALVPDFYGVVIQQFQQYYSYVTAEVQEASGMNPNKMGAPLRGRRTAEEVEQYSQGSDNAVNDASLQFDYFLKLSLIIRIQQTQKYLIASVENEMESIVDPLMAMADKYNLVLGTNPLFKRLKIFSGIEFDYKEFYERNLKALDAEKRLLDQIGQLTQDLVSIQTTLDSPIPPFQGGQAMAIGYQVATSQDQIKQYEEQMLIQREQLKQQVPQITQQLQVLRLQLTDVKPAPEPSDYLYYEIFTAPIAESDIVVAGSLSGIQKESALRSLAMLLETATKLPGFANQLDYQKIGELLTRGNGQKLANIKKTEAQIAKDEQQAAAQQQAMAIQQQQMQQQEQQRKA